MNAAQLPRLALVLALAAGCGSGSGPAPNAPASPTASASNAEGVAATPARQEIPEGERVPSPKLIDRRARNAVAPDSLGVVKSAAAPPKTSAEVYRMVAPATVIVRVPGGMGSGVVIDPSGWVLTNHHVVATAEKEDFRSQVTVVLGELSKVTGGMERRKKEFSADVYKVDKLRDLALLKIVDPPKHLASVTIAKKTPVPGAQVIAIGHAGAGMLWAIKAGEISALGKLSDHLAMLAKFKDDEQGREASQKFKKFLDERNLGLVIQSTCNILPGDSGGPLVTRQGELVGLNAFSNRDPMTGGLLNFHVHLNEIQKFVKNKPAKPAQLLPDPWKDAGGDASYEDVDLDGRVDVLLMQGRRPCSYCPRQSGAVFIDLDQSSYAGKLPPLSEVYEKHAFDAELVYLQIERDSYAWYDRDDDGRFDLLLFDPGTTGRSAAAYRIEKNGALVKDKALSSGAVVRMSLFGAPDLRQRLARISSAAFPSRYTETSTTLGNTLPDPVGSTGKGDPSDLDRNGKNDALKVRTAFSARLLLDVDENTVPTLPSDVELGAIVKKPGMLDAEVAVVSQSTHMWVWYDSDDDGRYDLALHSPGTRLYVATEAWSVDASGKKTPAPAHVGRKLLRPDLLGSQGLRQQMAAMVQKGLLSIMSDTGESPVSSFPDPVKDHRGAGFALLKVKGTTRAVVTVLGQGSDGYLIDLDENSFRGTPTKKIEISKAARAGKVDAEFAYFQRNGLGWAYYDTDGKGGYDLVLYSAKPRAGKAEQGFRIDKGGKVQLDPALAGSVMVRPSLFKGFMLRAKMKRLAGELFGDRMLEK